MLLDRASDVNPSDGEQIWTTGSRLRRIAMEKGQYCFRCRGRHMVNHQTSPEVVFNS